MVEIAELTSNDTLRLPARVAALFRPADRFMVWIEGDTLYLKRIMPRSVTTIVEKGPQDEPLSLDEIVTVHGFQSGVAYIVPERSSYGKLKT